jgi:DNA-directed RNA polymerase specialized sigma24 family protein
MLGISDGTSKSQLHKARLRLRSALSQPLGVEPQRSE